MIGRGLDEAYDQANTEEPQPADRLRLVVLSDHHKGMRDDADDFWRCEAAYNAALGYYLEAGYRLVVLGDAEELWESPTEDVVGDEPTYPRTLELEGRFLERGGYTRVWGNHDDQWERHHGALERALRIEERGDRERFTVRESLRLDVLGPYDGGPEQTLLGRLLLVHGHQGTLESELIAPASKFFVRHGWSNIQRFVRRPWNTPSRDHALRGRHNTVMHEWAKAKSASAPDPVILIAGHTHQPVFRGSERKRPDLAALERELEQIRSDPPSQDAVALVCARIEAERVLQDPNRNTPDLAAVAMEAPYYFNTGCCSFGDGGITGIEISDGQIRLIRWPWPYGQQKPERQILDDESLANVFSSVKERAPAR